MSQKHEIADSANAPWTLHALCMAEASPTTNDAAGAGPSASPPATLDDCVMGRPRVDVDLDDVEFIQRLKVDHPHDGEVMMAGHLTRVGVRIRLRASIHRVDPHGVAERSRTAIKRRVYSVPHADYIWHIDSYHKLIWWRMVTLGAIDGYSENTIFKVRQ